MQPSRLTFCLINCNLLYACHEPFDDLTFPQKSMCLQNVSSKLLRCNFRSHQKHRYGCCKDTQVWLCERPSPAPLDVCTFPCASFSPEEPWLGPSFPSVSPLCCMLAHPEIMVHDAVSNTGCYSVGLCWAVAPLSLTGSPPNYYLSSSLSEDFHDNGKPN